ncbi:MAG: glycosyltransferase [Bacteroidia bacterium]|nr:glycosyltransferase [Bacteroidia bacterium]
MISICIPIYNFDVSNLIKNLSHQSNVLEEPTEIILIDDCSNNYFKKINKEVCEREIYIQLEKNIGRAAIRNKFLEYASYNYLLFLDCDSIIHSDNFLLNYIKAIKNYPNQLICGGRVYPKSPPERAQLLRWKYGVYKESKPFDIRNLNPNKSFMTNNFLIPKEIFNKVRFNENLVEYGHEDTLFGYELKKNNIDIIHIDNPVLNGELESNSNYITQTEKAVGNLVKILKYLNNEKGFIEDVEVLRIYFKYFKLRKLIILVFSIFKPVIRSLLSKGYVNLYLFDFYKLGTLAVKINS